MTYKALLRKLGWNRVGCKTKMQNQIEEDLARIANTSGFI